MQEYAQKPKKVKAYFFDEDNIETSLIELGFLENFTTYGPFENSKAIVQHLTKNPCNFLNLPGSLSSTLGNRTIPVSLNSVVYIEEGYDCLNVTPIVVFHRMYQKESN